MSNIKKYFFKSTDTFWSLIWIFLNGLSQKYNVCQINIRWK